MQRDKHEAKVQGVCMVYGLDFWRLIVEICKVVERQNRTLRDSNRKMRLMGE